MKEVIDHPSHYNSDPSKVECIDIVQHRDFCVGNAIKYLWRAGLKIDIEENRVKKEIEDLKKAIWYINRKINLLESNLKGDYD